MAYRKLGRVDEIPDGGSKMYDLGDRWIGVFKVGGELFAIDDICSHAEAYLHEGALQGHSIECDAHGARFDIRTGAVEEGPALFPQETYGVRVSGDDFEVDL